MTTRTTLSDDRSKLSRVLLGVVGGPHGIKGEVRIKSFTADPTDIGAYGPLCDDQGNRYTIRSARVQKNVVVVRIAEVVDRNHAERLNGRELFVDRAALPEPGADDEFYLEDLVGFGVETPAGDLVGTVLAFHDFGAGDIVEIAPADGGNSRARGRTAMIPFSQAAVPEIDGDRRVMVVDPVAAGLDETKPEEGEDGA